MIPAAQKLWLPSLVAIPAAADRRPIIAYGWVFHALVARITTDPVGLAQGEIVARAPEIATVSAPAAAILTAKGATALACPRTFRSAEGFKEGRVPALHEA